MFFAKFVSVFTRIDLGGAYQKKDYEKTLEILKPFAEQGDIEAHKWYDIASANGFVAARIHREFLEEEKLTPSQIVEAQKLA